MDIDRFEDIDADDCGCRAAIAGECYSFTPGDDLVDDLGERGFHSETGTTLLVADRTKIDLEDALAVVDPDVTSTPCSETPPVPLACGSIVYVNFDFNSADIRPESDAVLADLFTGLEEESAVAITVEGHTSTEGTDEYNLDLSERRAQAVVDDLVARGIDPGTISSVGKGEAEPLVSPERDESGRAINRRVEVECG